MGTPSCFREQMVDVYNLSEQKRKFCFSICGYLEKVFQQSHAYPLFTMPFELSAFVGAREEQKTNERNDVGRTGSWSP